MIDTKRFFQLGVICFSIIGLAHFANFIIYFSAMNFFSRVASAAQVLFDFVTAGFFWYLIKTTFSGTSNFSTESSTADIEEALKEVEDGRKQRRK